MKLLIYISQWSLVLLLFLSTGLKAGEPLQFTKSYSKALKQAQKEDKLIFCFVYTSWSMPSQRMEETTLKDSLVVQELNEEYVTLYINASRNKDFAKDFEIHVFPSMLVIDKWGNAILRDSGYKSSTQLITMIYKTRSKSRYLRQSIDSLMMDVNFENILATVDSIILYRDEYTAKNIAKRYLDANRKNWGNEVCMQLLSDYFSLDKKYLRYVSKNHQAFFIKFDSIELKENIAFHVFINSLKKDKRGRLKFDYKPLRRWFKRFKFKDIEKIENFVRIKYLLWGRGPSVRSSIKLIENYPETSSESVLYSSVIRILLTENYRRSIDYDELIESIEDTLEEGSYWRYDVLALLYYKIGNQSKVEECIATAKEIADILGEDYTPILDYLKDHIN